MRIDERRNTPAIVCDADKLSQVAIIQELGRLGVPVVALAEPAAAIGFASRYIAKRIVCPVSSHTPEYISFLIESVAPGVIFYSNDANAENISRHRRELLANGFELLISDISVLERVIQKDKLYKTACECSVPVPKCFPVSSAGELSTVAADLRFPVILKSTNLAGGVYKFVHDLASVPAVFHEMTEIINSDGFRDRSARLMVQEWVPQENTKLWNFNACVQSGQIVCFSMGERIRTNRDRDGWIGSALLYGKTAYNHRIFEQNERILRHLRYDGIVETEWSESPSLIYLYDFNPRPSGNIRWALKSSTSIVEQYYRIARGLPPLPQAMRNGVKYAKIFFRQNDFLDAISSGRLSMRDKLAVLAEDLAILARCRRNAVDILDLSDPGPTLRATGEIVQRLSAALRRRISRTAQRRRPLPRRAAGPDHGKVALRKG